MRFRIVSDIHLEHWCFKDYTELSVRHMMDKAIPETNQDANSTLVLAGDISPYWKQREMMLKAVSGRFNKVVYVAGNHEHWGNRLTDWDPNMLVMDSQFKNVYISKTNEARIVAVENLDVIYATMWAPYGRDNPLYEATLTRNADCMRIVADSSLRNCIPKDFQDMYTNELASIKEILIHSHSQGRSAAVVTHHAPSLKLRLPGLDADPFDDMFMSPHAECFMHEEWAPKYWFFGHTHKAWDIQLGKTRCVSNPYGYPGERYMGWQAVKEI